MLVSCLALLSLSNVPFYKGVSLTPWSWEALGTENCRRSIDQMAKDNVDAVAVNVWDFQKDATSTQIAPNPKSFSSSPESIRKCIRWIHKRGMKVMLKPIVDLDNGNWRGEIVPTAGWFAAYRSFIIRYADLAREEKVEAFSVGVEYNGTQVREKEWREIVAAVRSRYKGLLTYSANFDSYQKLKWWDALDFVGIDAYFTLTQKKDPTVRELNEGWRREAASIEKWLQSSALKKPLVFTECGYRSIDGANTAPWDWKMEGEVDLQEQVDCLQSMFEILQPKAWWRGVFLWNWEVDPKSGGHKASNYTPQNKPAELLLRRIFRRS